jgi:hypothetical protein
MKDTNTLRPRVRLTGRNGSTDSTAILTSARAGEAPFDLRPWAKAHRFRTRMEDSYAHETDPETRADGQGYVEVVCRRGLIYPFDQITLLAWTSTRGVLPHLLALDSEVRVHQAGDLEAVVRFPVRLLDAVAAVLRPLRRRTLDPARARAIGARTAFRGAQAHEDALEGHRAAPTGSDTGGQV